MLCSWIYELKIWTLHRFTRHILLKKVRQDNKKLPVVYALLSTQPWPRYCTLSCSSYACWCKRLKNTTSPWCTFYQLKASFCTLSCFSYAWWCKRLKKYYHWCTLLSTQSKFLYLILLQLCYACFTNMYQTLIVLYLVSIQGKLVYLILIQQYYTMLLHTVSAVHYLDSATLHNAFTLVLYLFLIQLYYTCFYKTFIKNTSCCTLYQLKPICCTLHWFKESKNSKNSSYNL